MTETTELNPNVPPSTTEDPNLKALPEPVDKEYDGSVDGFINAIRAGNKKDKAREKDKPDDKADEAKPGETKTEKPDKEKAAEKPEPEKADKKDKEDEPAPAPRRKNLRPRPYVSDDDRVARVAAEAASKAAAEVVSKTTARQAPEPAPEPTFNSDLPAAIQNELKVLEEVERISPEGKGAKAKMVGWLKEVEKYQQRWQEAHPEEEFDENAPEHDHLFNRKPEVDPTLMEAGRISLAQKHLPKDKRLDDLELENRRLHSRMVQQRLEPMVYGETNRAIKVVLGAMDKALESFVESPEKLASLQEEDPVAWDAMRTAIGPAVPFIKAAVELAHSEGTVPYNPRDPAHVELSNFAFAQERVILARPEEKQYRGNLPYVSIAEYHKLSKDEQRNVWSLGDPDTLINFRISAAVQDAKSVMELEEKKHKAREKRFGAQKTATTQTAPETPPAAPKPEAEKPAPKAVVLPPPASGGARSVVSTNGDNASGAPKDFTESWLNNLRGVH